MAHKDENINRTYCQICKTNVAMPLALFNTTYVCEGCVSELQNCLKPFEVVRTEGISNDHDK